MKNFVIEIICQTASFRNPNFQNFHKSLGLPPPTTIIGFAGAALGLSPLQSQEFFDDANFKIGISGTYEGKCLDTWKYNKRTTDTWKHRSWSKNPSLFKKKKDMDGSIVQKEYLINTKFLMAFSSENEQAVERLKEAFENPVYALTMGNSDSLAHIKSVEENVNFTEANEVENCFMQGDVVNQVMIVAEKGDLEFSVYSNETLTYDLPLRFNYENDYGRRTISKIDTYSLINKKMKLNYKVEGVKFKEQFIPLFEV